MDDFFEPDDFDIPDEFDIYETGEEKPTKRNFTWTDKEGKRHKLDKIDNFYLGNIIKYLRRKRPSSTVLIAFLEKEQIRRLKEES